MKNYIFGGVILIGLSILGFWWLKNNQGQISQKIDDDKQIVIPTSGLKPIDEPEIKPTATPTVKPSLSYNGHLKVVEDGFEAFFSKDREVYKEYETTGVRYPLWRKDSIITVHVSRNNWCWIHPGRKFSATEMVAGKETFVYEIASQKIVDLENNGRKYTIQCVHNGQMAAKNECDQFLGKFKLL